MKQKYEENKVWFEKFTSKLDMSLEDFKEKYLWLYGTILLYFKKDTKTHSRKIIFKYCK